MRFGKCEIDWFAILVISFVILWTIMIIGDTKVRMEEEKTKQLQLQQNVLENNI